MEKGKCETITVVKDYYLARTKLHNSPSSSNNLLSLSGYAKGVYLLVISSNDILKYFKLLIQ